MKKRIIISTILSSLLLSTLSISAVDVDVKVNNVKKKTISESDFFNMDDSKPIEKKVVVKSKKQKQQQKQKKEASKQSVSEIADIDNTTVKSKSVLANKRKESKIEYLNKKYEPKYKTVKMKTNKEPLVYINKKDYVIKTKKEEEIEDNFKEEMKFQDSELKKNDLKLEDFINQKLNSLKLKLNTTKNDFKAYELELQHVIRSRANNRYAEKTIENAKLELYDARDKYNLNIEEIEFQIDRLKRYPKKSKDYLIRYNNISSKKRLLVSTNKDFLDLKKDYFENKFLLQKNYYKKLDELKKKYKSNKNKLNIYYELRTNTLINTIKGR